MRYLYFISQEESLLEMSVEKMVDIYLTETPDKLQNAEELQNHYQIDSSVIREGIKNKKYILVENFH